MFFSDSWMFWLPWTQTPSPPNKILKVIDFYYMGYKKSLFWNIQKVSKKEGTNDLKKSFLDLDNIFQNSSGEKIKQVNIFLPVRGWFVMWCSNFTFGNLMVVSDKVHEPLFKEVNHSRWGNLKVVTMLLKQLFINEQHNLNVNSLLYPNILSNLYV